MAGNDTNTTLMPPTGFYYALNETCVVDDVPEELKCEYVTTVVDCLSTSRIPYLELPYCQWHKVPALAMCMLSIWVLFLFVNLALVVDGRVVPNINTVSKALKLSDSLAGVTLLAIGNGAADIFSAVAAVSASEDGGMMMVSGLLGGGLFVTTIVSGLLAYKFEPGVELRKIARDCSFFLVGIGWMAFMLADGKIQLWETVMFLVIYVVYVVVVVVTERIAAKKDNATLAAMVAPAREISTTEGEKLPLLQKPLLPGSENEDKRIRSASVPAYAFDGTTFITHQSELFDPPEEVKELLILSNQLYAPGSWRSTLSRFDLLNTSASPWSEKSVITKVLTILQMPVRFMMILAIPVVHHEDKGRMWDRTHHMIIMFISIPLIVFILEVDALYWFKDKHNAFPWILFALGLGISMAIIIRFTTSVDKPPRYISFMAGWGFLMALVFIYAIADEIVSVLRSFGIFLGVPISVVGLTVLGMGNGMCDLIANYLCAANGLDQIALAAAYGGPTLNLLVGVGIAGMYGCIVYESHFEVESDTVMFLGLAYLATALLLAIFFSTRGIFSKTNGIILMGLYGSFIVATVAVLLKLH